MYVRLECCEDLRLRAGHARQQASQSSDREMHACIRMCALDPSVDQHLRSLCSLTRPFVQRAPPCAPS